MSKFRIKINGNRLDTSSKGNLQVVLEFTPTGEYDGEGGELYECQGKLAGSPSRRMWLTITENTADRRVAELAALAEMAGKTPVGFESFDPGTEDFINLSGIECDALMDMQDYKGKTSESWSLAITGALPQGQGGTKPSNVGSAVVRQANAAFGKLFKKKAPATVNGKDPPF